MQFRLITPLLVLLASMASGQLFGSGSSSEDKDASDETISDNKIRNLNVTLGVDFVDSSPLGVKLVNGEPTRVSVGFTNYEEHPMQIEFVGGGLWDPKSGSSVKNFTALKIGMTLPKDQKIDIPYQLSATEMQARDLLLSINVIVTTAAGELATVTAFNSTVSIVEPESSLLDPQLLFLYLVLSATVAGIGYFVYTTWLASVMPKPKRAPRPVEPRPVASTTGTGSYDESWIPEHHLKRPQGATRARSGTPKGVKKG